LRAARWIALAAALMSLGCATRTAEIRVPSEAPGRRLTAYVVTPEGSGPFPTAILLHGCSGLRVATTHQATYRLLHEYASWYELVRTGIADPRRAVVQGLSHGGTTVLQALDRSVAERSGVAHRFAAGIAYYPACSGALSLSFYAPLLVLIGELDDWTPAVPCVQLDTTRTAAWRRGAPDRVSRRGALVRLPRHGHPQEPVRQAGGPRSRGDRGRRAPV